MRIAEFSKRTHVSKKTIHFYIQSDLLHPDKTENNYYDFTDENLKEMHFISLMRHLGVSISTIKECLNYPGAVNYFLYTSSERLKDEIKERQLELERIRYLLEKIPPNATPDFLDNIAIDDLPNTIEQQSIDKLYPMNNAYLIACFLLVPWVSAEPNHYRKFLWNEISSELYSSLKKAYKYLEYLIYNVNIETLHHTSVSVSYLIFDVGKSNDLSIQEEYLRNCCEELIKDKTLKEKWMYLYHPLLEPLKKFYISIDHQLFNEYTKEFTHCKKQLLTMIKKFCKDEKNHDLLEQLSSELDGLLDSGHDSLYSDLYLIFTFKESFYTLGSIEEIKDLI